MTIRVRIAVLTAILVAVAVAAATGLIVRQVGYHMRLMARLNAESEAMHYAELAEPFLEPLDKERLQRLIDRNADEKDIQSIHITDRRGIIIADSLRDRFGKVHPAANPALASGKLTVGPVGSTTTAAVPIRDKSGKEIGAAVVSVTSYLVEHTMNIVLNIASSVGMLSVIIGAILAYLLALYLTAPLSNILVGIRRVATGDFEHRVVPPQAPELRAIGESFNDMSLAIRRRIRNLELLNQMASEVSMARRLRHIANTVEAGCEALLDVDARMWVLDQFGEKLQSVPTKGVGTRVTAHPDYPVTKAARESKVMVVGEGNADLPPGSQVSQDVPAVDAAVIVPMRTWEGAVGSIVAVAKPGVRAMTQEQVSLAVAVANIAAPAVAALVRNESQARSARMLQRILVPQPPFAIPGIEVASRYEPADEAGRLGGDFFDFTHLSDGSWCFAIGDVSGKGLPAAQYAAMAKYVIRSYALEYKSPLQAVTLANSALSAQMGAEAFITIFCGILDIPTGRIRYARAGHPPPLVYRKEAGDVISLRAQGPPAGAFEDAVFVESEETFAPGDVLVMFTDGLIEARRHHEMFGEEELAATLQRYGHLSPRRIVDSIVDDVRSYAGGKLEDDMAIVVVKIG